MKILSEEEFAKRTAGGHATAVFKEFLADRETPVAALSRLDDSEDAVLFESVVGAETRGRYSFLIIEPYGKLDGCDALEKVKSFINELNFAPASELPSFQGGCAGYVPYDSAGIFEPKTGIPQGNGAQQMAFLVCKKFLIFDNVRSTVTIAVVEKNSEPGAYSNAMKEIDRLYDKLLSAQSIAKAVARAKAFPSDDANQAEDGNFTSEMTKDEFCSMVAKCKEAIAAGEVIQIVPSQKFTASTRASGISIYRALRTINPSPYNFFMRIGSKTLIGSSPEELVKLSGRTASTSPIAGTRPRGLTAIEDQALERELRNDVKENAEHVMLVDLGRNDIGRVAETGSVKVESYANIEKFSHVMHLVSSVKGTLASEHDACDLLKAVFPAGTLTGAPKVRAMQLISEFEKSPRGIYGGAAGYFSFTGDMDFAIVIRTLVKEGNKLTMRAGAGIVADSVPEKEYEETVNKSKAVFEAVKFAESL